MVGSLSSQVLLCPIYTNTTKRLSMHNERQLVRALITKIRGGGILLLCINKRERTIGASNEWIILSPVDYV